MVTVNGSWWQAPSDTLDSIGAVLMAHWRAATAHPQRLFWPHPGEWLTSATLTTPPLEASYATALSRVPRP
jgi:hypothetical protein